MNKIAIVYYSSTGNTEAMANAIADAAKAAGADVTMMGASDFGPADISKYDVIAFGCPAMGSEQLEESEYEPMFASVEGSLSGKKIALFGSYAWADGQWMRDWCERAIGDGAVLYAKEGLISYEAPEGDTLDACTATGTGLASF